MKQMSYAQWSKYTQYQVGSVVAQGVILYVANNIVGPSTTSPNNDPTNWSILGAEGVIFSANVKINSLTWVNVGGTSFYQAGITKSAFPQLAGLTFTGKVVSTLFAAVGASATDLNNLSNNWLVASTISGTESIIITLAGNPTGCSDNCQITFAILSYS